MKPSVTRLDYCQYLLVGQINYTLTNFADHLLVGAVQNHFGGGRKMFGNKLMTCWEVPDLTEAHDVDWIVQ